ncbi:MAG: aldolase catalytic domain-containing protein [Synergistaceae bacterium]
MKSLVLDCTLRDGGYINNWCFGNKSIKKITDNLLNAKIDIIECGFLSDINYDKDVSLFCEMWQIEKIIPSHTGDTIFVAMLALGDKEIDYDRIPACNGLSITGIRLTFHKNEIERAREFAVNLKQKGYKVFMQPVGTMSYTDLELLHLVDVVNQIKPFAFYIVDTLGCMYKNELLKMFYLVDNNLNPDIYIGFHSHNNLQLSFSNAQELIKIQSRRNLIVDSSLYGMGRGSGNLCTELIADYINSSLLYKYNLTPVLELIDDIIRPIYSVSSWGYSVPYYLAAVNRCHPNYASYLVNKQTISMNQISEILEKIPQEERDIYNKNLIENVYINNQKNILNDKDAKDFIADKLLNKEIVILAPGHSLVEYEDRIKRYTEKENTQVITINFRPNNYRSNFVFLSNLKRMTNVETWKALTIVTSNLGINSNKTCLCVDYGSLIDRKYEESDNAGMMLIRLLKSIGIKSIKIAGYDGFDKNTEMNYVTRDMINSVSTNAFQAKNASIREQLLDIMPEIDIKFLTPSKYLSEEENEEISNNII